MTDMDISDTARILGVSERTVRRWLRQGRLAGYRVGRRIRIPEASIREAAMPYGTEGSGTNANEASPSLLDPIVAFLEDPARLQARRERAARTMDEIAASTRPAGDRSGTASDRSGPASHPPGTAENLMEADREEDDRRWDRLLGLDRS